MIVRAVHDKNNPYFQLDRTSVNDERLSYKAIGIHTYLMSKPDGWEANETDISARHTDGRSAIRSGIQELIDYGYMVRVQLRKNKKVVAWRLDTYEAPQLNPHFKPGQPTKVVTIDLDALDLECENLNVGSSNNDRLECEKLQVEKLDVENRTHSNYIYTVTNELKREGNACDQPATPQPEPAPPISLSAPTQPVKTGFEELLNASANRNNGGYGKRRDQVFIEGMQSKLEKYAIDSVQFRAMVDDHLSAKGTKVLADGDSDAADRELRTAQQFVLDLYGIGRRFWTIEGVKMVWDSWKTNDKRTNPSEHQLLQHASQMVNGKVGNAVIASNVAKPSGTYVGIVENLR